MTPAALIAVRARLMNAVFFFKLESSEPWVGKTSATVLVLLDLVGQPSGLPHVPCSPFQALAFNSLSSPTLCQLRHLLQVFAHIPYAFSADPWQS